MVAKKPLLPIVTVTGIGKGNSSKQVNSLLSSYLLLYQCTCIM